MATVAQPIQIGSSVQNPRGSIMNFGMSWLMTPLLPVGQGELALGSVVLLGSTTSLVILGQSAHVDRVSAEASRLAVGPAWFWLPYWHGRAVPSPA
jgi:hypothetical protein